MLFFLVCLVSVVAADLTSALAGASNIAASDASAVSAFWASIIGDIPQLSSASAETTALYSFPSLDASQSAELDSILAGLTSAGASVTDSVSGSGSGSASGPESAETGLSSTAGSSSVSAAASSDSSGSSSSLGGACKTGPVLAAGAIAALGLLI